jgi:hypothetical protein
MDEEVLEGLSDSRVPMGLKPYLSLAGRFKTELTMA